MSLTGALREVARSSCAVGQVMVAKTAQCDHDSEDKFASGGKQSRQLCAASCVSKRKPMNTGRLMPCPSDFVNGNCTVTLPWHLAICCGMPVTLHLCILPSILGRGCPVRKWSGIDFFGGDERCKTYCFIACKDARTP